MMSLSDYLDLYPNAEPIDHMHNRIRYCDLSSTLEGIDRNESDKWFCAGCDCEIEDEFEECEYCGCGC
jgi:hypothetical protein